MEKEKFTASDLEEAKLIANSIEVLAIRMARTMRALNDLSMIDVDRINLDQLLDRFDDFDGHGVLSCLRQIKDILDKDLPKIER